MKKVQRETRAKKKSDDEMITSHPVEEPVPHHSPKRMKSSEDEHTPTFPMMEPIERRKKSRKIDVPDAIPSGTHWKEDELSFLSEVKRNIGSNILYAHFLKMMKLYFVDELLSKEEILQLCEKLFAAAPFLNDRLIEFMHSQS